MLPLLAALGAVGGGKGEVVEVYTGHYIGEVVPTPRRARYFDRFLPLYDPRAGRALACVVLPERPHPLERRAALEVGAQVGYVATGRPSVLLPIVGPEGTGRFEVTISVGRTALLGEARVEPPDHPEGYVIRPVRRGGRWLLLCVGREPIGTFYAAQSLLQLITKRGQQVVARQAEIVDRPGYRARSHQFDGGFPGPEVALFTLRWMEKFKLNQLGFGQAYDRPMEWRRLDEERLERLKFICNEARRRGTVRVCFYVHPFRSKPEFNIKICRPQEIEAIVGLCRLALREGAAGIMLRADDIHPLSEEDRRAFGDKAAAHAHLIREMDRRLRAEFPDMLFMFCPPYYQGYWLDREEGRTYLEKIGRLLPKDVVVIWTGPVTRSLEIRDEDLERYSGAIGRAPMLWDNTVYAHRSRYGYDPRHPHYFFDTFETRYPRDFPERTLGITYNWNASNFISLVGAINTADYLWNPEAYDPEASLRRALAIAAGPRPVDLLLSLREAYYTVFDAVTGRRELEAVEELLEARRHIEEGLERLRTECENRGFVKDVEARCRRMLGKADKVARAALPFLRALEGALLKFDLSGKGWRVEAEGRWRVKFDGRSAEISFPWRTKSFPGAFGAASVELEVPKSPTGRLFLAFSVSDDYDRAGKPPRAWPGYLFKQVLLDGQLVWEDDVEGSEPLEARVVSVEITDLVKGKQRATLTLRRLDERGVSNMGVVMRWSHLALLPKPPGGGQSTN